MALSPAEKAIREQLRAAIKNPLTPDVVKRAYKEQLRSLAPTRQPKPRGFSGTGVKRVVK